MSEPSATFALQAVYTKGGGGVETAARHYGRMFRDLGVDSVCLYRGPSHDLMAQDLEVIEVAKQMASPIGAALPLFGGLRRQILARAKGKAILAVVHSPRMAGAIRRMFPSAKIIVPGHSDKVSGKLAADLVVALNPEQQARFGAKAALLGNPYIEPAPPPLAPSEPGPPRVVFCARFTEVKDPDALLRAAPLIAADPKPELVFVGSGPLEDQVREAAKACPLATRFEGWRADPWAAFRQGDILVLPSSWEGLPYLLLEALDRGLGVIASDIAGNRQALGDGAYGLIFKLGDDAALAAAIDQALADPRRLAAMAEAGRTALRERYGAAAFWGRLSAALAAV